MTSDAGRVWDAASEDRVGGRCVAVAVSTVAAGSAVAAKGGNNDTANLCQKGGWQSLFSATGDGFVTQGDCVNDGAQGREVFTTAGEAACDRLVGGDPPLPLFHAGEGTTLWECQSRCPRTPEGRWRRCRSRAPATAGATSAMWTFGRATA